MPTNMKRLNQLIQFLYCIIIDILVTDMESKIKTPCDLGSISSMFYALLLHAQIPKAKNSVKL